MAITVKHKFVSAIPDGADATVVKPSNWNDDHDLTGTIPIANGGTGQATANDAFNALAPSQTGNTGKYLTTNGTDSSWAANPLGTVTSVAATVPSVLSIAGSPITTSGTLAITYSGTALPVLNGGTGVTTSTGTTNVVLSGSPTIVTPVIAQINDANGNAELKFSAIASAVNQVTIENAATGNPVHIYATGTDTSIGIHLAPKGASGYVNIQGGVDSTKRFMFNPDGGTTNTRTMLSTSQTVDRTLTLPDATDTLVGKATTDTFTNKSISGSTNTLSNIGNASLTNSAITINGTSTSLGGSISVGTVTSVTGTAPVVSSGGATPAISMAAATTSVNGYLTSTDWTTFNGKQAALVSGTNIKTVSGTTLLGSGDLGVIGATYGGTGQSVYAVGDIVYASTTTALSKLADVATGNALISGGVGVAPSYGKIGLTTHVSGNLPVTNLNSGTSASSSTFWRGDGTWAAAGGGSAATPTALGTVYGLPSTGTNAAVGYGALQSGSLTGTRNSAFGNGALSANTSGVSNTAVGINSNWQITTGSYNTAVGDSAIATGNGSSNTAVGVSAMSQGVSGSNNVAMGSGAGSNLSSGTQNSFLGSGAGSTLTTGANNIILGYNAAPSAITVSNEITLGNSSITSFRIPALTITAGAKWFNNGSSTVALLPSAATAGLGARAFVTDALAPSFGVTVAGSGAVATPVYSDGTNWKVG